MARLLYKEFKLAVHVTCFLFPLLACMLLIPNYPYYVAFFYQTLGIFFMFMNGNITNDVYFSTLLPVRKRDVVRARVVTVVILELAQILAAIPFALLRYRLLAAENAAGMEANAALFGLVFVMFGIFNLTFLPLFYRTAFKVGTPYLIACAGMTAFAGLVEAAIHLVPGWAVLDTVQAAAVPLQMMVLLAGILISAGLTLLAYTRSVRWFEKLDL